MGILGSLIALTSTAATAKPSCGILFTPSNLRLPTAELHAGTTRFLNTRETAIAMLEAVQSAQKSIRLSAFLFGGPDADAIVAAMIAKHREGKKVQVLLDRKLGTISAHLKFTKKVLSDLKSAGIEVVLSRKLTDENGNEINQNHNKYLVIDDNDVILGSTNLAPAIMHWMDVAVWAQGSIAKEVALHFDISFENFRTQKPPITFRNDGLEWPTLPQKKELRSRWQEMCRERK